MKCKYCGNYNADGVFYCTICGNALTQPSEPQQTDTKLCAVCGKPSPKSSVFCGHCGKKFPSKVKHDDNNGTAPLYILDFVDKYIGDIMLGIASSGGVLRVYRDRVEYEITRTNMNGSVTGMMDGEFNNVPVSVGTIETYKYTEIQGCYVSNYLNSRPGILFILNNGVRFKFVCLFGAAEPTDVIRTINAYVDQARQMAPVFMQPQYQQFYPQQIAYPQPPTPVQPNQDMQPQPYPQPIAYPQPPTPVQPNQDMQPQPYPQPIAYPQPPTPVQPNQDMQPQQYPQPIAYPQPPTPVQPNQDMQPQPYPQPIVYPQPPTPVQPNQDMQPQPYPQPIVYPQPPTPVQPNQDMQPQQYPQQSAPEYGYAYPQGNISVPGQPRGMQMPSVRNVYSADNYAKFSFVMEINNFIRVDEQYVAVMGSVKKGSVTKGEVLNVVSRNGLDKGSFEVRSIAVNKAISDSAESGEEETALLCSFSPSMLKAGDIACI